MGTAVSETRLQAKLYNWHNNSGAALRGAGYDNTKDGVYSGNLFLQWFTNSDASRSFSRISGDQLYEQNNNNSYGGPYTTPNIGWAPTNQDSPYTHSTNPWDDTCSVGNSCCVGCTNSSNSSPYSILHYGQTTILNDTGHSFWTGISNLPYGWSDCTNNGNCDYHESGYSVWLFWVK